LTTKRDATIAERNHKREIAHERRDLGGISMRWEFVGIESNEKN
jgi:hypothetical protein